MKKIFPFIAMFFLLFNYLFARDFSIGIKHGINKSGINFEYDYSGELSNPEFYGFDEIRNNFNPGIIFNYSIKKYLSLQTEFNLVNRGFEFFPDISVDADWSIYGEYKTNYLSIPLLTCFEFGKTLKGYIYGGFYLNLLLDPKNKITITSFPSGELHVYDYSYDPKDEFSKSESGIVGGIGIKIPVYRQFQVFVDSRYEYGLTKAIKEDVEYGNYHIVAAVKDAYNKAFTVSWGILYTFKNKDSGRL